MTVSTLYSLYRAATAAAEPVARHLLRWRERSGKEDPQRLPERTGIPSRPRPAGPLAWLHGASVGEGVALLPLIDALVARGLHVLVTTGTVNSARVLAARLPAGVTHQYVPLDVPRYVERFLAYWRPTVVMLAESELWPNLVYETARRSTPLVLVNARMSERSARRWARADGFIRALLARTALCLAQSEDDALRYARLGAPSTLVTGNVKYDVPPPPAPAEAVTALMGRLGARPVWVAASTHAEEEILLLDVHEAVLRAHPDVLTILVPRQPGRGLELAEAAAARGLRPGLRTRGDPLEAWTGVYVADTIGELGLFYRIGDLVFLGKSLAGGGGQNPIEAAKLSNAVLHGPLVGNFDEVYGLLDAAGGAREVADAEALAAAVSTLLADPAALRRMARAAVETMESQGGATARTLAALEPLLPAVRAMATTPS